MEAAAVPGNPLRRLLVRFDRVDPDLRREAALLLLFVSLVLMVLNVAAYLTRLIDETMLLLITLILSWLAITITCLDVLLTSDVRKQEDEGD